MENSKLKNTEYDGISSTERELLANLADIEVFTPHDIVQILGCTRNYSYQIAGRLLRKHITRRIGRGKYILLNLQGLEKTDLLSQASNLTWPSYVSMWTALSRYHLTETLPQKVYVVVTKQRKDKNLMGTEIVFVKLSKKRLFGYRRTNGIFIAEMEKALLDSLLLPQYAGGVGEVFKCLGNAWPNLDKGKLVKYALQMKSRVLIQRLGYLIEAGSLEIDAELLQSLHNAIGKSYSRLDPTLGMKGNYKNRWKLIVNLEINLELGESE